MHQSASWAMPHFGLLRGICRPCHSRGWGICQFCAARGLGICQPQGYSQAVDTHAVSYQNITTQKILLEKQAYWFICQGQEKRHVFDFMHAFLLIAYQARITWRNRELST